MVKVVILIGGPIKGTRFRPLSLSVPKPLFPIGGKPVLYHQIEAACKISGLKEVILMGFYKAEELEQFVKEAKEHFKIPIKYCQEQKELGTAGGMVAFSKDILEGGPQSIVCLHGDICCAYPLQEVHDFHVKQKRECTILSVQMDREHSTSFGCLVRDEETNELLHYVEKPSTFVSDTINGGIYCFEATFLEYFQKVQHELESNEEIHYTGENKFSCNGRLRLEQDILAPLAGTGRISVFPYTDFWRQIKNAGSAVWCNELLTRWTAKTHPERLVPVSVTIRENVIIEPSAKVDPTAVIGPNVYIGQNVVVGKGARIFHSIVLDNSTIKDYACLLYTTLSEQSDIGMWARVEGIPNPTPFLNINDVRQGITIMGIDTKVNPEIVVYNCIVMPHKTISESTFNEIIL